MRLDNLIRKLVPYRLRIIVGIWSLGIVCRSTFLLRWYVRLLHGYNAETVRNLRVAGGHTEYQYHGRVIKSPSDGTGSLFEVFYDQVYDSVWSPKKGDVVIDVGAYVGMWSVRAALEVGETGRVFAVEPDSTNLLTLHENVKGLPVAVLRYAISNHDGVERLYTTKATTCHSTVVKQDSSIFVPACTIDDLVVKQKLTRVDFIKIDAEGAELKVLRGAERTLKGNVRLSIASYHDLSDGHPEAPVLIKFLEDRGFTVRTDSGLRRYIYAEKTG